MFFTNCEQYENKVKTKEHWQEEIMLKSITQVLSRRPHHVMEDLIGVAAIFLVVFVGLSLPGLT